MHKTRNDIPAKVRKKVVEMLNARLVDTLAERITALGGTAVGTVRAVASRSSLKAYPENITTGEAHLQALAAAIAMAAKATRAGSEVADDLDDEVTADLLIEITSELDKDLWLVEAHLP